jgi:hypothetical protein
VHVLGAGQRLVQLLRRLNLGERHDGDRTARARVKIEVIFAAAARAGGPASHDGARPAAMSGPEAALPGGDGGDAAMAEPDVAVPSAAAGDAAGAAAASDGAGVADAGALAAPPADGGAGEQPSGEHQPAAKPAEPAAEPAAGGAGGEGGAAGGDGAARCVACAASAASAVASHALTPHALAAQRSAAAARARSAARTPRHRAPAGALALAARPLMTAISAASTRPGGHASSHASHAPFAQPLGVTCARLERARTKLASCPDDLEAWEAVLAEARTRPLAEARQLYDSVRPPRLQQRSCALRGCTQLLRRGISGRCA